MNDTCEQKIISGISDAPGKLKLIMTFVKIKNVTLNGPFLIVYLQCDPTGRLCL